MALTEATLGAIISAAGSVAGAGVGAANAALSNRRSYKWSKKFFDYQNQYNQQYYSPVMNMERYRQAGINPNLVAGSGSGGTQIVGSMDVPQYQSPLPSGNEIGNAVQSAISIYNQQRQLQNNTDLVKSQVEKNNAEANKINFYNANIQPFEMEYAKNRKDIPLYQISQYGLQNEKLMNDISLFSLQKQKYQLALDMLEIEKKYADEYYSLRNSGMKSVNSLRELERGVKSLDLSNYQKFGIRPQDPYYLRIASNIMDSPNNQKKPGLFKRLRAWWRNPWHPEFYY